MLGQVVFMFGRASANDFGTSFSRARTTFLAKSAAMAFLGGLRFMKFFIRRSSTLRLAFFGSDAFSVRSLERLVGAPSIASIDVITRNLKRRGKRSPKELPVGVAAKQHGLQILRADTAPEIVQLADNNYDLAVAVSYGALVPQPFLKKVRYGGLNVHPSLLPRWSGSSPIQYALMNGDKTTGVSVQTLHPTKFDRGKLLMQKEHPIDPCHDASSLTDVLGALGGEMLREVIEKKLYLTEGLDPRYEYSLAPKLKSDAALANWSLSANQLSLRFRAFCGLYTFIWCKPKDSDGFYRRVKFLRLAEHVKPATGKPGSFHYDDSSKTIIVNTSDGQLAIAQLLFECCNRESAESFWRNLQSRVGDNEKIFTAKI